jgi:hypothetical protein
MCGKIFLPPELFWAVHLLPALSYKRFVVFMRENKTRFEKAY